MSDNNTKDEKETKPVEDSKVEESENKNLLTKVKGLLTDVYSKAGVEFESKKEESVESESKKDVEPESETTEENANDSKNNEEASEDKSDNKKDFEEVKFEESENKNLLTKVKGLLTDVYSKAGVEFGVESQKEETDDSEKSNEKETENNEDQNVVTETSEAPEDTKVSSEECKEDTVISESAPEEVAEKELTPEVVASEKESTSEVAEKEEAIVSESVDVAAEKEEVVAEKELTPEVVASEKESASEVAEKEEAIVSESVDVAAEKEEVVAEKELTPELAVCPPAPEEPTPEVVACEKEYEIECETCETVPELAVCPPAPEPELTETESIVTETVVSYATSAPQVETSEVIEVAAETEEKTLIDSDIQKLADLINAELALQGDEDSLKKQYCSQFSISEKAFDLVDEFYNEQKENELISNVLLRKLFAESLKDRSIVHASEEDIERALKTVDVNNDEKINLPEFFQLLVLFFSSKNNLSQRIESVLQNKSVEHEQTGLLTSSEACGFKKFLDNFYGQACEEVEGEKEEKSSFFSGVLNKLAKKFEKNNKDEAECKESVNYNEFSAEVAGELENSTFVKFE